MEWKQSKERLQVWEIAKSNLRHNAVLPVLVAAAILVMTPVLFGTANLSQQEAAVPMEMFVSLIGIVLLTPVFQPEENRETGDLVASKYTGTSVVYCIRAVTALLLVIALVTLAGIFIRMRGSDLTAWIVIGTAADAVFLGALGMLTAALTDNTVIAYMIPLFYYMLNYGAGGKLGNFYLFSMISMNVPAFRPKLWLLAAGAICMVGAVWIKRGKERMR